MADRIFKFTDKKIHDYIVEKGRLVMEGRALAQEFEEIQKKLLAQQLKVQKIKNKIIPAIEKVVKKELGEYEEYTNSDIEGGEIVVTIANRLEEWKKSYNKKNKK